MSSPAVVDIEGAVVAYLAGRADVAALAGERIATLPPPSLADPFVRVRLLNAPQPLNSPTDYLTAYLVQTDCYAGAGGTSVDALELATAVRLAIHEMPGAAGLGATITGTNIAGFQNLEDIDIEPPRPRYLVTATIWAHP